LMREKPGNGLLPPGPAPPLTAALPLMAFRSALPHPGGNPGANRWFLRSTPIQMPQESGGICGRLTYDLPLGFLQRGGSPSAAPRGLPVSPLHYLPRQRVASFPLPREGGIERVRERARARERERERERENHNESARCCVEPSRGVRRALLTRSSSVCPGLCSSLPQTLMV